jgi:hypothetical protein
MMTLDEATKALQSLCRFNQASLIAVPYFASQGEVIVTPKLDGTVTVSPTGVSQLQCELYKNFRNMSKIV